MRTRIGLILLLLATSACGSVDDQQHIDISSLYSGHEQGSWYHFNSTCSAALCDSRG